MDYNKFIEELQQRNRELAGKLAVLQKQFDDALVVTRSFDVISNKNTELEKEVHLLRSKNEDLNCRLKILTQSNNEMSRRLNDEKNGIIFKNRNEIEALQDKVRQVSCEKEKALCELNLKIQKDEKDHFITVEKCKKEIQRVLDAATHYFSTPIQDSEVLTSLLLMKQKPPSASQANCASTFNPSQNNGDKDAEKSLKTKVKKLKNIVKEQAQTIDEIFQENSDLKNANACLKGKLDNAKQKNDESKTFIVQVKDLQQRNIKLKSKLTNIAQTTENLEKKNSKNEEHINQYKNLLAKKEAEIERLREEASFATSKEMKLTKNVEELNEKYSKLNEDLKETQDELNDKNEQLEKAQSALTKMKDLMHNQKNDLDSLESQRLKLISHIQVLMSSLSQFESLMLNSRSRDNKSAKNNNNKSTFQTFTYYKFPEDLNERLSKISPVEAFKDEACSQIYSYYNEKINSATKELENSKNYIESEKNRLSNIIQNLTNKVHIESNIDYSLNTFSECIDAVQTLQNVLLQDNAAKDNEINEILTAFHSSSIDDAKSKISELKQIKRKNSKLQEKLNDNKEKNKNLVQEYQNHLQEVEEKLQTVKNSLLKTEQQLKVNESDWDCERCKYISKIKQLEQQIQNLNKKSKMNSPEKSLKKENKCEMERLNQTIADLQNEISQKEAVIAHLRSFTKFFAEKQSQKHKNEQELLKNQLNQMIYQLKDKNIELKKSLGDVKDKMEFSEKQYAKAKSQISNYNSRIQELEIQLESYQNDAERKRSLIESKSKAEQMIQEANYQSQIEDSKLEIENAKRDIMSYVALQFSSLFNTKAEIDSSNFEAFIQKLRYKFDKLITTDNNVRHMLSLNSSDSLEFAVSQLLRAKHK